ncbi:MAG: 4Fe-4S dicluster domain-containing protein [Ruminococcus sp.]|nr:4Fe-4S dicluster domain-containing protein [Ruminococcus sp.]
MITNDGIIIQIKHKALCEVAKLVFAGKFEAEKDELPYQLFPGPKASYRCCVYKEREIVRQRIRLAEGKNPQGAHNDLVVQVIPAACEDCPISRYVVTDNCQKCMGKACQQSCNFGAISIGVVRAHIDPQKCRECGKCAAACPYNAIADLIRPCRRSCPVGAIFTDENGLCTIDEKKCIQCGKCIHSCPFGAISSKSSIVEVCQDIMDGKRIYAMMAPSAEGQFGENITFESWRNVLKEVGFTDLVEVGLGGDMTAYAEAAEWAEAYRENKKMTTSCCPGFFNLIRLNYPDLEEHISTTVSPMCAVSRWIKQKDPEAKTLFIGPCIAKKSEVLDQKVPGSADYALTFGEIRAIIRAREVTIKETPETCQQASTFGKWFGNSGGVTAAVLESMKEQGVTDEVNVERCNGTDACKRALLMLKMGRFSADFIEGMVCDGGCVGGPSRHLDVAKFKKTRETMIQKADSRNVEENLKCLGADQIPMHREDWNAPEPVNG